MVHLQNHYLLYKGLVTSRIKRIRNLFIHAIHFALWLPLLHVSGLACIDRQNFCSKFELYVADPLALGFMIVVVKECLSIKERHFLYRNLPKI
ncbi:hypothetical protein Leryth_025993 [Lithospermum erythrorhizon]|nr:hypothetical protein Leryth_025993 [Lithospermum erythrorhizon]